MRIFCALALLHAVSPRYGFPSPESGTVIVTDRYTDLPFTFTPRNSRCVGVHATPFVAAANYSGHAGPFGSREQAPLLRPKAGVGHVEAPPSTTRRPALGGRIVARLHSFVGHFKRLRFVRLPWWVKLKGHHRSIEVGTSPNVVIPDVPHPGSINWSANSSATLGELDGQAEYTTWPIGQAAKPSDHNQSGPSWAWPKAVADHLAPWKLLEANLPPSFHPFAVQTAAWLSNRLPRHSRGNQSPMQVLTRSAPDLAALYCFGCLCAAVTPTPRREGDRHFADRGEYALYLGPSEESPAHVIYMLSSRRVTTVAKIRVWEDEFPGLKGERYSWFTDVDAASPDAAVHGLAPSAGGAADHSSPDAPFQRADASSRRTAGADGGSDGEFMRGLREDIERRSREHGQRETERATQRV